MTKRFDRCGNCKFAVHTGLGYQCRRRSPSVDPVAVENGEHNYIAVFPLMKENDWCGDFEWKGEEDG